MDQTPPTQTSAECWFCGRKAPASCECHRAYCQEHGFGGSCLLCALGLGLFEQANEPETLSGIIMASLSAASGDPYIVVPQAFVGATHLSIENVEKLVLALIKMLEGDDLEMRRRAVGVLAAATNSWPTLDPSALNQNKYGASLLASDQVRRWLLHVLKQSRSRNHEGIALIILEKLRTADFRDVYPGIESNFKTLTCSNTRVRATFEAILDYYPAYSHLANELCELFVYEQYANRARGAGATLERIYGPLLKQSPTLARMLKKGAWLSSHARYQEWYYGEDEPV